MAMYMVREFNTAVKTGGIQEPFTALFRVRSYNPFNINKYLIEKVLVVSKKKKLRFKRARGGYMKWKFYGSFSDNRYFNREWYEDVDRYDWAARKDKAHMIEFDDDDTALLWYKLNY